MEGIMESLILKDFDLIKKIDRYNLVYLEQPLYHDDTLGISTNLKLKKGNGNVYSRIKVEKASGG